MISSWSGPEGDDALLDIAILSRDLKQISQICPRSVYSLRLADEHLSAGANDEEWWQFNQLLVYGYGDGVDSWVVQAVVIIGPLGNEITNPQADNL